MITEVFNITYARNNFLNIANNLSDKKNILITKENNPLLFLSKYKNNLTSFPLIILGATKKHIKDINNHIKFFNKNSNLFSKIILVYSKETQDYINKFKINNLFTIQNEKYNQPLISSLKLGLNAIEDSNDFFIFTLLNRNIPKINYEIILNNINLAKKKKKTIIMLKYKNKTIHPVAFNIKYKKYFLKLRKELGLPYLIRKFKNEIFYIGV